SLRQKARGNLNGAERTLRRALNLAPDDPMLLTNFGSLLGISGRYRQAVEVLRGVVRRSPHLLEARVNLGAALGKQGHVREAIQVFEETRTLGLSSPALLNALAVAYTENRQRPEAIRALEDSLGLERDQPVARAMLEELRRGS
ncbi:MAG: tetratricopeptide repeat protein, partial [Acidobacteriota bacterium]